MKSLRKRIAYLEQLERILGSGKQFPEGWFIAILREIVQRLIHLDGGTHARILDAANQNFTETNASLEEIDVSLDTLVSFASHSTVARFRDGFKWEGVGGLVGEYK